MKRIRTAVILSIRCSSRRSRTKICAVEISLLAPSPRATFVACSCIRCSFSYLDLGESEFWMGL